MYLTNIFVNCIYNKKIYLNIIYIILIRHYTIVLKHLSLLNNIITFFISISKMSSDRILALDLGSH